MILKNYFLNVCRSLSPQSNPYGEDDNNEIEKSKETTSNNKDAFNSFQNNKAKEDDVDNIEKSYHKYTEKHTLDKEHKRDNTVTTSITRRKSTYEHRTRYGIRIKHSHLV